MRFVEVRSSDQINLQALHWVRDRFVAHRIRVICQICAFCPEYGIAMHKGWVSSSRRCPVFLPIRAMT